MSSSPPTLFPSTTPVREVHMHPAGVVFLTIVALYGTIGNIFIIGAVSLKSKLRVRGNAFVVNLAVADLIICAYIMPLGLVSSQYNEEPFGAGLCDFNGFLLMTSCGVSTQTLMMIGFERYCHVCKMQWYRRFFTTTLIAVYITVIWIYTSLWTCQGLTGWSRFVYGQDVWLCIVDGPYSLSYNICLSLFGMLLPMMVVSFCYFMIFRMIYKSRKRLKTHRNKIANKHGPNSSKSKAEQRKDKKEFRLIIMLFTIVILFVIFWTPAAIVIIFSSEWTSMPKVLYTIAIWMALANSSLNSIVYGIMNQNFRDGYLALFNKIFCSCADEDKKLKCTCCKIFSRHSEDESTSASQSQGTTNVNVSTGENQSTSPDSSPRKHLTDNNKNKVANVLASNDTATFNSNQPRNSAKKVRSNVNIESRPTTGRTVMSMNEVTIRSDSKVSLRSNTSIGSLDDDGSLVAIEGVSRGTEALLQALSAPVGVALESITGEDNNDDGVIDDAFQREGDGGRRVSRVSTQTNGRGSNVSRSIGANNRDNLNGIETMYPITESEV